MSVLRSNRTTKKLAMRAARRTCSAIALAIATSGLLENVARADERAECASAADLGQQQRDEGKYRRAREQFLVCARETCPAPVKRDCVDWLQQLEAVAPTVVFSAKDAGKDLSAVKVYVDGALVADRIDGKPVQMDLGKHVVRFDYGGTLKEEEVVIGAGQKNRSITMTFRPPPAAVVPPPPTATTPPPVETREPGSLAPSLIVGGVGVVALGSFAYFGLTGASDVSDLEKTCKGSCAQSDVDAARSKLLIADISLGVGIVALGVATYLFLTRSPGSESATVGTASAPAPGGLRVATPKRGFTPILGLGSVGARF